MFYRYVKVCLLIVLLTLLGCSPDGAEEQAANQLIVPTATVIVVEPTRDLVLPTATPDVVQTAILATAVATVAPTATPTIPYLLTMQDMNVRSGPGVAYAVVGFMEAGRSAEITAVAADSGWWKIACPPDANSDQCWISGGTEYTQAHNADGVPFAAVPELPATATPEPVAEVTAVPTAEPEATAETPGFDGVLDVGFVAFVSDGNLWTSDIYRPSGLIGMSPPVQITFDGNLTGEPLVSPDGTQVAVVRQLADSPAVLVAITLSTGDQVVIADGALLPLPESFEATDDDVAAFRIPYHFIWTADSQSLIFNTATIERFLMVNDDLWLGIFGEEPMERFAAGLGGGEFAINARNQLILTRPDAIERVNLDGSGRVRLLDFDFVYTYSEYAYYPKPYWSADGATAFVAIPSQEQLGPDASITLWQFSADATATAIGTADGNFLFLDAIKQGDEMIIAPSCVDVTGRYFGRNASQTHALFTQLSEFTHSIILANMADGGCFTLPIDAPSLLRKAEWIMDDTYLVYTEGTSGGQFQAGLTINEPPTPVLTVTGSNVSFDLWLP